MTAPPGCARIAPSPKGTTLIDKTDPTVASNIDAMLKVLDPADNATGGGTASALAGAMAAGLVAMVARLSLGKDGMEPDEFYQPIIAEAEALATELFAGCREDSDAFLAVRAAFKLPKADDEQIAARKQAIQAAWVGAACIPLANARRCKRTADLAKRLAGKSNPDAASDLLCARELSKAGLAGCAANVQINLPSIKDPAVVEELTNSIGSLLLGKTE